MSILLMLLMAAVSTAPSHLQANPVYRQLLKQGLSIDPESPVRLTSPVMPDGLRPEEQMSVIEKIGGDQYPLSRLIRESTVAPHILHQREVVYPDQALKLWRLDVYFVAYGDFEAIATQRDLSFVADPEAEGEWHELSSQELAQRNVSTIEAQRDREVYGYFVGEVLNQVQVSGTVRAFWSRTDQSLVAAARLDSRFLGDAEFPNQWRPLERDRAGRQQIGAPRPYRYGAAYVKITRLSQPQGAMFVECHCVAEEPLAWFEGKNLLGAKLPAAIQSKVRSARRELLSISEDESSGARAGQ